jgi:hypothetical protein
MSCGKQRDERFYVGARGRTCDKCRKATARRNARSNHLKKTYGITLEDEENILEYQGGRCGACGQHRPYNLAVDHDHKLGSGRDAVRGALCKRCNKVLRDIRDDPQILLGLWLYLESPPAKDVLR